MGFYLIDDEDRSRDELYQYVKQHFKLTDQQIEHNMTKLQDMFSLDMSELIDMLWQERDELRPDDESDTPPDL